jgi:hypothetical protein
MVTNSFKNKNVMQSMRRLNMSSRDFLFWVLLERGEWGEGSKGIMTVHLLWGECGGQRGCFYWGLANVPEKLEMSQSM